MIPFNIDQSQTGSQNCLILRKLLIYFFLSVFFFFFFADKIRNLKWSHMSTENGSFFSFKEKVSYCLH